MGEFHVVDKDLLPYSIETQERKPTVSPSDFSALDIRTGKVISVRDNLKARSPAYVIEADFGPVVGVLVTSAKVKNYSEEDLVGRNIVAAINLGTKRIAGVKSEFLILGALMADGEVRLLTPDGDDILPGQPIG